ncbi:MAG: hypothetical protein EOO73_24890 [Myxococcales bacterium]|nr:MAG: hypothetical protein EOO73_24890 [Myxococcales bacterium]
MTKIIGIIVAVLATFACSSSDDSGSGAGSTGDFCADLCRKDHACDQSVDLQTCRKSCETSFASAEGKLRADFLTGVSSCYASSDCATILEEGALGSCASETEASLAPSMQGTSFCKKYSAAVDKCGGTFNKTSCLSFAKTTSDPALLDAEACLGKACTSVDACVDATL